MKRSAMTLSVPVIIAALFATLFLALGGAAQEAETMTQRMHGRCSEGGSAAGPSTWTGGYQREASHSTSGSGGAQLTSPDSEALEATAVAVSGTVAYAGFGPDLFVLDISDPQNPQAVAEMVLDDGNVEDMAVRGAYLYVANEAGGLSVISVTDPLSPTEIGRTAAITPVTSVAVSDEYAYVAGEDLGVVSIANPADPTLIGDYTDGRSYTVDVHGDYAYVLQPSEVAVISVSNPASPALMGSVSTFMPYDVDAEEDYAYVADYLEGLQVVSVTVPTTPAIIGNASGHSYASAVEVSGNRGYLCGPTYSYDGTGRLHAIDITDPTAPTVLDTLILSGGCTDLALAEDYAYVANSTGIRIISVAEAEDLVEVGAYSKPDIGSVTIEGLEMGLVDTEHVFTGSVSPPRAATPITYVWSAEGQPVVTDTGGLQSTAYFTWHTPGIRSMTVTAENEASVVTDTHVVVISTEPMPAGVRYVAPTGDDTDNPCSWSEVPCRTIQRAVDEADHDDTIKIASGMYTDLHRRREVTQVVYISKTVTLRGGYAPDNWDISGPKTNRVTLDALGQGRVLYIKGHVTPTITGLRITGGDAAGLGGSGADRDAGGGVYVQDAGATLTGNEIVGNTAELGGGMYLERAGATVSRNEIRSNTATHSFRGGGGLYVYDSPATLSHNTIVSNSGHYGGGLALRSSNATLQGNIIVSNTAHRSGGGLEIGWSDARLENSVVVQNHAENLASGIYILDSSPALVHTTVASNSGGDGSGIYVRYDGMFGPRSSASLTNTIVASQTVGIVATAGNTLTVNGILWHNSPITVSHAAEAVVSVRNQIKGDPRFAADGYHITADSAAVDKGVETDVERDIDGEPRLEAPDLGVDEYRPFGARERIYLPMTLRGH